MRRVLKRHPGQSKALATASPSGSAELAFGYPRIKCTDLRRLCSLRRRCDRIPEMKSPQGAATSLGAVVTMGIQ